MENYLEIVLLLQEKHGHAHTKDIADELKIKMPSVTEALGKLKDKKLINYQPYGTVQLTKKGTGIAQTVYQRHQVIYCFLRDVLGVNEKIAQEDACQIEHVINKQTFNKLRRLVQSK
jgi:DtxR family transcriptional regulator, Mn-dependent transcriptional regulator